MDQDAQEEQTNPEDENQFLVCSHSLYISLTFKRLTLFVLYHVVFRI